ncbi:MAG: acetylornithine deacetylase [Rhodospirillales bacterium]|nr:MAG: acetylornithine deacetylase [Rhodospirillales bacterium]
MLARLVGFDTTSAKSNRALIDWVRGYFAGHGVESTLVPNAEGTKASLYASIGPKVEGGVVLSGHTDVVPVDGQPWDTDPWTLTDKGGRLYGRGSCDMKGFVACALAAVPRLRAARLKAPVHFAFSYDEEVGCLGAHSLAERLMGDVPRPRAVVIGEPTMMGTVKGHKGQNSYGVVITGFEAHSSMTHLGVSAIHFAGELIHFINGLQEEFARRADPANGYMPPYGTFNVGTLDGGTAGNILARECALVWEYRQVPGEDGDEARRRLQAHIDEVLLPAMRRKHPAADIAMTPRFVVPAFKGEENGEAETLARAWSGSNASTMVAYATEAGIFQGTGVSTIVCGPGDIAQAHQPNEFVLRSQLDSCDAFLARMIAWAERG